MRILRFYVLRKCPGKIKKGSIKNFNTLKKILTLKKVGNKF